MRNDLNRFGRPGEGLARLNARLDSSPGKVADTVHSEPAQHRMTFSLRTLFVAVTIAGVWIGYFVWSQRQWSEVRRANAEASYRTMRSNLEMSHDQLTPADYQRLRKKIDSDWQAINPGPIPDYP